MYHAVRYEMRAVTTKMAQEEDNSSIETAVELPSTYGTANKLKKHGDEGLQNIGKCIFTR